MIYHVAPVGLWLSKADPVPVHYVHIFKNVIFQEVLNILYFKIIPTISQIFDSNFGGPKLTHTLYSPFWIRHWLL